MAHKLIYGIRPVADRLASGLPLDKVYIRQGSLSPVLTEICNELRQIGVPVQFVPIERLDQWTQYGNHQGIVARLASVEAQRLDRLIPMVYEAGRTPLFVWLDGVTDLRNAGAIARTALELGADALLIPMQGGPPLSADMMKTSAGALNHLPVCRIANADRTAELLIHSGIELIACTEKGSKPIERGPVSYTHLRAHET
jgi:23S rRNA (guanosine2251-2'-O)-methyltransferase